MLGSLVQADAVTGGVDHGNAQQGKGGDQHQGEYRFQGQRYQNAAQQEHGRANSQALHAVDHLVNVVNIAVDTGHQGRYGEAVHLRAGKMGGLMVQV